MPESTTAGRFFLPHWVTTAKGSTWILLLNQPTPNPFLLGILNTRPRGRSLSRRRSRIVIGASAEPLPPEMSRNVAFCRSGKRFYIRAALAGRAVRLAAALIRT